MEDEDELSRVETADDEDAPGDEQQPTTRSETFQDDDHPFKGISRKSTQNPALIDDYSGLIPSNITDGGELGISSWALGGMDSEERLDFSPNTVPLKIKRPWRWLPSYTELKAHRIHDIEFVTSCLLLLSSSFYCTAAWAALASTIRTLEIARWIRILQMIAGFGFMISRALFTIETQAFWYWPEVLVLGWHLNVWDFIGSLGFTFTAAFGIWSGESHKAEYQFGCSYLWGEHIALELLGDGLVDQLTML